MVRLDADDLFQWPEELTKATTELEERLVERST